jgi:hypothetical protein
MARENRLEIVTLLANPTETRKNEPLHIQRHRPMPSRDGRRLRSDGAGGHA